MTEYFVRQFDGGPTACDGRNCACATGATAVAYATGGAKTPTSDQFRTKSGVSCVPGKNSPSGGLYISDIERTCAAYGVAIDFNRRQGRLVRRTAAAEKALLTAGYGMHCLGDYDQVPAEIDEQPGFNDDHSTWVHDYRASDDTVCWHDPLGKKPRRVKWSVVVKYHHKPGSEVRGLAGFVRIPAPPVPPDTSTEEAMQLTSKGPVIGVAEVITDDKNGGWRCWRVRDGKEVPIAKGTRCEVRGVVTYNKSDKAPQGYTGYLILRDGEDHVLPSDRVSTFTVKGG